MSRKKKLDLDNPLVQRALQLLAKQVGPKDGAYEEILAGDLDCDLAPHLVVQALVDAMIHPEKEKDMHSEFVVMATGKGFEYVVLQKMDEGCLSGGVAMILVAGSAVPEWEEYTPRRMSYEQEAGEWLGFGLHGHSLDAQRFLHHFFDEVWVAPIPFKPTGTSRKELVKMIYEAGRYPSQYQQSLRDLSLRLSSSLTWKSKEELDGKFFLPNYPAPLI